MGIGWGEYGGRGGGGGGFGGGMTQSDYLSTYAGLKIRLSDYGSGRTHGFNSFGEFGYWTKVWRGYTGAELEADGITLRGVTVMPDKKVWVSLGNQGPEIKDIYTNQHDAINAWAKLNFPYARKNGYVEYSANIYWTRRNNTNYYGVTGGIRYPTGWKGLPGDDFARDHSPGVYDKDFPHKIPIGGTLLGNVHIHVFNDPGKKNQNFSSGDYINHSTTGLQHWYLVTPTGIVYYRDTKSDRNSLERIGWVPIPK